MKQLLLIGLFGVLVGRLWATDLLPGYLITHNQVQLTGKVGQLSHTPLGSYVVFVNDFGTEYVFHAALLKGVVYQQPDGIVFYESKVCYGRWFFLKVIYRGELVRLYQSTRLQNLVYAASSPGFEVSTEQSEYWIEQPRTGFEAIHRFNFRRRLRRLCADTAPQLAQRIGREGYRFKDLPAIVAAYEAELIKRKQRT